MLDNFSTGNRANLAGLEDDVEIVEGELRSYERVHNAVRGVELVFHQGALPSVPRSVQDPLTTSAVTIEGTLNVLLAARDEDVRRVVYASSSSVYGNSGTLPRTETQQPDPISPYAVAKLAAERYCVSFDRVYGLETVALRYFNVFGPRQDPKSQYAAVVPRFIAAIDAGDPVPIHGDGTQSRDFTYVANVVEANLLAGDAGRRRRRGAERRHRPPGERQRARRRDRRRARQAGREGVPAGAHRRRARLVGGRRGGEARARLRDRRSASRTGLRLTAAALRPSSAGGASGTRRTRASSRRSRPTAGRTASPRR